MFKIIGVVLPLVVLVASSAASQVPASQERTRVAVVSGDTPIRLMPDANRQPLATIPAGTSVRVLKREGDWSNVSFSDPRLGERFGYVLTGSLTFETPAVTRPSKPAPPSDTPDVRASSGEHVFREAAESTEVSKVQAQRARFSDVQIDRAIEIGKRGKGRAQGAVIADGFQQFTAALGALGDGPQATNGFRVQILTPLAWVQQLASDAAKEYRNFSRENVTDEVLDNVVRVIAYPDTPNTVSRAGMRGSSSVRHVVMRDESKRTVIQPIFKEAFTEEVANAVGGRASFEGLHLKFSADDVRELRGKSGDQEFFVTVIGSTGEEKNFKVKKKHFDDLP